ncbi:MAG: F-box protein [Kistimonas sp.]|nr:F-box protein [Kistimonas sp.]
MQPLPDNGHAHSPLPPAQAADPATFAAPGVSGKPARLLGPSSCPQYLPAPVLNKIVSYLPLSAQCRCARVCRHWHDCLLAPELRLSGWLLQHAPVSCLAHPQLGRGFDSRARPFLQAVNSPVLPALMHLQQQQQQHSPSETQQDAQQLVHAPATSPLLSRLLHQGLNRELTRADQLRLRPVAFDWPNATRTSFVKFSPCCRWLAVAYETSPESTCFLRLYGWEEGHWQQQNLIAGTTKSVLTFTFAHTPPDTLFSVHGRDLVAWRQNPETNNWHCTQLHHISESCEAEKLYPMVNGNLVIVTLVPDQTKAFFLIFLRYTEDKRTWTPLQITRYNCWPSCWTEQQQSCQVALGWPIKHQGRFSNTIQIWTENRPTNPTGLVKKQSDFPDQDGGICKLTYSPDGQHLLGMLSNGRAVLWKLDRDHRLQEQFSLPGCLFQMDPLLEQMAPFSRNGQYLALPCSLQQIQLCYCDDSGHWQYGELLSSPAQPDAPADILRLTLLSPGGQTLVRCTNWFLDIWHRHPDAGWQHQVQRQLGAHSRMPAYACFLEPGELVCTMAEDPELSLQIYGPDSQGQLIRKTCMTITASVKTGCAGSPDGLSLLLANREDPPMLLQLEPPARAETGSRAGQEPTPAPEPAPEPVPRRPWCWFL